jgi:large subunit ribosomal protein L1
MPKKSKRYRAMVSKTSVEEPQSLDKAVEILKGYATTKFDQTVEIAIRLGVDPKQADQIVRGSVVLPNGIGRTQRVIVFAKGDLADAAKDAGADEVGQEELAKKIKDGWLDFDVCIAAPDMMGLVGPLGRVLGPRGLMPSPRAGTVTPDVAKVISEYKAGKVEFRNDASGIVHAVVGKLSFEPGKLGENIQSFVDYIQSLKPIAVKGTYVKGIAISATMSPSVQVAA